MTTANMPASALDAEIDRARRAQRAWADLPLRQRLEPVRALRRLLVARCDSFAEVIGKEVGKSPAEVVGGEVLATADACRFLEREAGSILRPRRISSRARPLWMFGQSDVVHRRPRGVVGIIGTWNYPLFLNGVQIVQALVAGNAVLWKPSEIVPGFAKLLHEILLEAGFPADLVQRLAASREMGPVILESALDHLVFTGSATVGRRIAARLGERLISSTLELSGCDVQLVLQDADVQLAARAAWFGVTLNRGQTCIAVRRALVHRTLYPAYCDLLRPLVAGASPVRLAMPGQVVQFRQLLDDAVSRGGRLLAENVPGPGDDACRPAVVVDARPEMALCRDAAFAPIMAVMPFDTIEEALTLESRCPYALGASIFTGDRAQADRLATRLRAGAVTVNDVIVPTAHPATPFGGRGESGWGTTQGAEGLLEMTIPQVVSARGGAFRPHYDMSDPRKQENQEALLRGFLMGSHGPTLGQRLGGWWRVIRAATKGL